MGRGEGRIFPVRKRDETVIGIPNLGMVKKRHTYTCCLSEMLIEVPNALRYLFGSKVTVTQVNSENHSLCIELLIFLIYN